MTSFDDREKAFENKWAHDQDMAFKIAARRNKLLGLWAAEYMGKTGAEADEFAKAVVIADLEESGHEDVFRFVRQALDDHGAAVADEVIRAKMAELLDTAEHQIQNE